METKPELLCKSCAHYRPSANTNARENYDKCAVRAARLARPSLVDGIVREPDSAYAESERFGGECGPEGKLFVPLPDEPPCQQ